MFEIYNKVVIQRKGEKKQTLAMFTLLEAVPERSEKSLPSLALTEKRPWSSRAFSTKHVESTSFQI